MKRLLLVSNSTLHGSGYLDHCAAHIQDFLGRGVRRVSFVPYALADHAGYTRKARERFEKLGYELSGVQEGGAPRSALEAAEAVFVGGGNTFRLLARLYELGLRDVLRARLPDGLPYIGSSAGSNVACVTVRTTNDMPIVEPPSLSALGGVPFNINPHYLDPDPRSTHMGETREERLRQFHEENDVPVVGLREGALLRVEGPSVTLLGTTGARLFRRGREPEEFVPPARLDFLLGS